MSNFNLFTVSFLPMTVSQTIGEIPSPGLRAIKSLSVIICPLGKSFVIWMLFRAIDILLISLSLGVFIPLILIHLDLKMLDDLDLANFYLT